MNIYKIDDMKEGWYIGDFLPSAYRTSAFEVSIKKHPKGEVWPKHYHKAAIEINMVIEGKMKLNDTFLEKGDIFVLDKMEIADPTFFEDCVIVCVKTPSIIGDKYIVER